jgi:hypothetical protein
LEVISNENIACIEVSRQIDGQGWAKFTFSLILEAQLAVTKDCDEYRVTRKRDGKSRRHTKGFLKAASRCKAAASKGKL